MHREKCLAIALTLLNSGTIVRGQAQEPGAGTTTVKGVLTIIKGEVYTMQDLSGRFVQF